MLSERNAPRLRPRRFALKLGIVAVLSLALIAAWAGCRPGVEEQPLPPVPSAATPAPVEEPATEPADLPEEAEGSVVRIKTNKGDIVVELFDEKAPITAGSFLLLAESGYYDGIVFHRVEPGFVIQGGDPTGTGAGGPGFTIPDEIVEGLRHDRGLLSMAKTAAPDTGGSQFFVCLGGPRAVGHLDGRHAVFGQVLSGMEVVDQIRVGDRMEQVTVEQASAHAPAAREAAEKARVHQARPAAAPNVHYHNGVPCSGDH